MRHRYANNTIKLALASADIPSALEPPGLCLSSGKRPDGQTLLPWTRGKPLVWDFTCVHRKAASYQSLANQKGPTVANAAETKKIDKYDELRGNFIIQPIALETNGAIGEISLAFLRQLGRKIEEVSGDQRSSAFLRQRIAINVQMGNAACVLESMGDSSLFMDV